MSPLLITCWHVAGPPVPGGLVAPELARAPAQGLIMAWMAQRGWTPSAAAVPLLFDLLVVRSLGAPLALYAVMRAHKALPSGDVLPPNLMSWTMAIAAGAGVVPVRGDAGAGGPAAGVGRADPRRGGHRRLLLGLLLLATQTGPFSQMVGVLRIENAIALFELAAATPAARSPAGAADAAAVLLLADPATAGGFLAQTVILVLAVWLFRRPAAVPAPLTSGKVSAVEGPPRPPGLTPGALCGGLLDPGLRAARRLEAWLACGPCWRSPPARRRPRRRCSSPPRPGPGGGPPGGRPPRSCAVLAAATCAADATARLLPAGGQPHLPGHLAYLMVRRPKAPERAAVMRGFAALSLVFLAACNLAILGNHLLAWIRLEGATLSAVPLIIVPAGGASVGRRQGRHQGVPLAAGVLALACCSPPWAWRWRSWAW
ncbi:MAG: hypothetical protein IPO09_15470 [Anaeromyxobacter sp.]|nr:hypothetical protein [Anaeromyxobacter sp.]